MPDWIPANQVAEVMAGVSGGYMPQPVAGGAYARASGPAPSGMAIASMVLGIMGVLGAAILTSVPAIICGHIARRQIRKSKGLEQGKGIALTGLILGYALPVVLAILAAIVIYFLMFILGEVAEGVSDATGDFWDSLQTIGQ